MPNDDSETALKFFLGLVLFIGACYICGWVQLHIGVLVK